ncbi:rifin PIR protein,putative [Plasmodium sp. DRC-Itaito]|nr:rifin PIR protein,putative [Plasmodium sp. DRC-Itaito]
MKLHYSKIILFFLPLNILVTSYHVHNNNNEPYVRTHHTPKYISRVLSEGDTQSSNYDKDADIKSVREQFDDRTSERLREYDERMQEKRQKRKEQRDKNIQKIIEKDKMEKSLAEKVEKVCLMCGCGLGGVAASVGIFGTVAVKELTKAALVAAEKVGATEIAAAKAMGVEAGINAVIEGLKALGVSRLDNKELVSYITATNYTDITNIARAINSQYKTDSCVLGGSGTDHYVCTWVNEKFFAAQEIQRRTRVGTVSTNNVINKTVEDIVSNANKAASVAEETAIEDAIKISTDAAESTYAGSQTAIIASVVAILIIALVMIIIYLVLRYRRKKKMKKKAEYTKLLEE